jgi:hypothetical protein
MEQIMTILATKALPHGALGERASSTAECARLGQNNELLSPPSLDNRRPVAGLLWYCIDHCQCQLEGRKAERIWPRDKVLTTHFSSDPKIRIPRLLYVYALVANVNHYACEYLITAHSVYVYMKSYVYLYSVRPVLLALLPLVQPRRLPAHLHVAPPQRPILPSTRSHPLRRQHMPLPPHKLRPPVALVCLRRWPPPQVPWPLGQPLATVSRRCSLAAAQSLHR